MGKMVATNDVRAFFFTPGIGWSETMRESGHVLQDKMMISGLNLTPKPLSDVAHIDDDGTVKRSFKRMLPSPNWVTMIVALSQGKPPLRTSVIENHLSAVGALNPLDIAQGKPGMASSRVKLIP